MYAGLVLSKVTQSLDALRMWRVRQWGVALAAAATTAVVLGWVTVLIPNPVFGREVPPTSWSYPVWIVTSLLTGLLVATYLRAGTPAASMPAAEEPAGERASWLGMAGTVTGWFAIGCPVCNKIALLALGYSGALSYFAPVQPWLGVLGLVLLVVSLVYRLSGQVACPVPRPA